MRRLNKCLNNCLLISFLIASLYAPRGVHGQLTGQVNEGRLVVLADQSTAVRGVNFISNRGFLDPVNSSNPDPFQFLLSNSPRQITWGNLGVDTTLDGEWVTGAGYRGGAGHVTQDLVGFWGDGPRQVPLPIDFISGGVNEIIEIPETPAEQVPQNNPIGVFVAANNQIVIESNGYELNALNLSSPSGGLIPARNAAPFSSLESNQESDVGYFSPRSRKLDGQILLSVGWDSTKRDLTIFDDNYRKIFSGRPTPCNEACPLPFSVTLDEEQRFVLHGSGQSLTSLDFFSEGSLVRAEDASPFESLEFNAPEHIGYRMPGGLKIDGAVTLSSGWNTNGLVGDVLYEFTDMDGRRTSGLGIPTEYYLEDRHLDAIVTDDNQIQLTGTGHRVNSVQFTSRSGSLVPGNSPAPFDTIGESNPNSVLLLQSDGNITLDGDIILDVGWNPQGQQDLKFRYDGVGNWPNGSYYLSRGSYPTSDGSPRPEVWISLDEDYRIILNADGKELLGLDIASEEGSLVPSLSPDPFSLFLSRNSSRATLGGLAQTVEVEGSIRTEVQFNPFLGAEDISVLYGENAEPVEVEVLRNDLAICPGCEVPAAAFSEDGQMWIEGFEEPLSHIEISSASGSLVPLSIDASDFATAFASESEVHLVSVEGVDALVRTLLPVGWESASSQEDVQVRFTLLDGAIAGPFDLAPDVYQSVTAELDLPRLDLSVPIVPDEVLPEPSGIVLLMFSFGLLQFRERSPRLIVERAST